MINLHLASFLLALLAIILFLHYRQLSFGVRYDDE
jgi:hypothetical protein